MDEDCLVDNGEAGKSAHQPFVRVGPRSPVCGGERADAGDHMPAGGRRSEAERRRPDGCAASRFGAQTRTPKQGAGSEDEASVVFSAHGLLCSIVLRTSL